MITAEEIYDRLRTIKDPCSAYHGTPMDLVELGMVGSVDVGSVDGVVEVNLMLDDPLCIYAFDFMRQIETLLVDEEGVNRVVVGSSADDVWTEARISPGARERLRLRRQAGDRDSLS